LQQVAAEDESLLAVQTSVVLFRGVLEKRLDAAASPGVQRLGRCERSGRERS